MLSYFKHWLEPPCFPGNEGKNDLARTMNTIGHYYVLVMIVAALVFIPLVAKYKIESWGVILAMLGTYAVARFLLYRGQLAFAGLFMVTVGWLTCIGLSLIYGGIYSPMLFAISAITIAVGLLFPPLIASTFLVMSILASFGFAILQHNGVHFPQFFTGSPLGSWFIFALSLIFIHWTTALTMNKLETSLALARRQNNQLGETEIRLRQRNQEMQTLYQTSLEITRLSDLSVLLNDIVYRACALLNLSSGALHMVRPEEGMLEMVVGYQTPPHWIGTKIRVDDGLAGQVVQTKNPFIVEDYKTWKGRLQPFRDSSARRVLGIPIVVHDEVIGALVLIDNQQPGTFSEEEVRLVSLFAGQAAVAIENSRLYAQVQHLAITDGLTGLYNRLFFDAELDRLDVGRDSPVSIITGDLDNMKTVNDTLGHIAGDELLKNAAAIFRETFRAGDVIARIGGDEFGVLLPAAGPATVNQVLDRIRAKVNAYNCAHPDLPILISLGVATGEPGQLCDALVAADRCMYAEKAARKSSWNHDGWVEQMITDPGAYLNVLERPDEITDEGVDTSISRGRNAPIKPFIDD